MGWTILLSKSSTPTKSIFCTCPGYSLTCTSLSSTIIKKISTSTFWHELLWVQPSSNIFLSTSTLWHALLCFTDQFSLWRGGLGNINWFHPCYIMFWAYYTIQVNGFSPDFCSQLPLKTDWWWLGTFFQANGFSPECVLWCFSLQDPEWVRRWAAKCKTYRYRKRLVTSFKNKMASLFLSWMSS